jgi:hypothetical protein
MALPQATQGLKPDAKEKTTKGGYVPKGAEKKVWDQFLRRKSELLMSRTNVLGQNIDMQMRKWDKNYFNRDAEIPASELDPNQKPIAINNAFGKVQAALGIMIDRNPEITLNETNPKYSATRELMRGLATYSWQNTNSLGQLKLSIFNCAKRGWFVGRTYNRVIKHKARFLEQVGDDGKEKYVEREVTKMDDIQYQNLNNYNAWIDEQAMPDDMFSVRDWMWREVWHIDDVKRLFPKEDYPNMEYVVAGGDTQEIIGGLSAISTSTASSGNQAKVTKKGMTEIFFYENQYDDWLIVEINGVMVGWMPLPQNSKRLSLVTGYWNMRSAETIYGIGVVEEMEKNEQVIDRILNMTLRQLLLTITPPGFYTGAEDPEDDNLRYTPGVLRRVLDPKSIVWAEIPPGNQQGQEWISWLEGKQDQMTGITGTIEGEQSQEGQNPTAFELGVNREAGLKRLRLPLKSIQYALEWEFNNRIALIQQVYSDFDVEHLESDEDIFAYLDETQADPDFYFIENEGKGEKEKFYKKNFREVQLNLSQDDAGNFTEADNKKFFKIKPQYLAFEGTCTVDVGSILVQSEELEQADTLRLANIVIPLLTTADPNVVGKPVKQLFLAFNKDPKKWLPDKWVQVLESPEAAQGAKQTPAAPAAPAPSQSLTPPAPGSQSLDTVVPPSQLESTPNGSSALAAFSGTNTGSNPSA